MRADRSLCLVALSLSMAWKEILLQKPTKDKELRSSGRADGRVGCGGEFGILGLRRPWW